MGNVQGGVLVNVQGGGGFSIFRRADDVTRTMSKGGCAWCSTHPSSDPPPPPGWLATGLYSYSLGQSSHYQNVEICISFFMNFHSNHCDRTGQDRTGQDSLTSDFDMTLAVAEKTKVATKSMTSEANAKMCVIVGCFSSSHSRYSHIQLSKYNIPRNLLFSNVISYLKAVFFKDFITLHL